MTLKHNFIQCTLFSLPSTPVEPQLVSSKNKSKTCQPTVQTSQSPKIPYHHSVLRTAGPCSTINLHTTWTQAMTRGFKQSALDLDDCQKPGNTSNQGVRTKNPAHTDTNMSFQQLRSTHFRAVICTVTYGHTVGESALACCSTTRCDSAVQLM
jgi:hypothetical protein